MSKTSDLILLSAGGTGGHMFPAAALARDLQSRGYKVALATDKRGEQYTGSFDDVAIHIIKSATLGKGLLNKIKSTAEMGMGIAQALNLLSKLSPAVVVGFGGYPSVPAVYAAQKKKIPTIIHEQNAILGQANIFLAPKADRIALSMPQAQGLDEADMVRTVVTGNPVRDEIAALYNKPYPVLKEDGPLRILIMGGSLGAHILANRVPAALAKLSTAYRDRLEITQQCRPDDLENVRKAYKDAGIKARLETFFDDIPAILEQSHLVIARSGASSVAEISTAGRPAIFVPYPHHKDQQQKMNADTVADAGGAWVMTEEGFTEEALLTRIETFLYTPETLFRAAEAARSCGKPDAARRLGNLVTAIASGWDKADKRAFDLTQGRVD